MARNEKKVAVILIMAAIALNIKYIFTDFGIDAAFQASMSYRHATGDMLLRQMWEPCQASAFLCALFVKIYLLLFKTTTGIVIYLQAVGALIDAGISVLLYRTVNRMSGEAHSFVAFAVAWTFFVVSPKDVQMPDYANMQLWFTALLCICLFNYLPALLSALSHSIIFLLSP